MTLTHLELKSENSLYFIGEGNEHVVLGLSNTENVIRFRKFPLQERIGREDLMLRVQDDLGFINEVARPLAGSLLVDEAHLVSVDPLLLEKVMERIKPLRDEKRLCKAVNKCGIGILSPNVATQFIERRQTYLKFRPTILNFQMDDDVITVYSVPSFSKSKSINPASRNAAGNAAEDGISSKSNPESIYAEEHLSESHKQTTLKVGPPGGDITELIAENKQAGLNVRIDSTKHPLQDYKDFNALCIELKPKQGFAEPGPLNHSLCRFCLKQYIKMETKAESVQSSYCPRDLFSGDPSVMEKAIQNLFSCPQNNLKIFSNGRRIRDLHQYRYLSKLIVRILTYEKSKFNAKIVPSYQSASSLSTDVTSRSLEVHNGKDEQVSELTPSHLFPQGSQLPPSSCLGHLLYLQSLGNVPEVYAAKLCRELNRRTPSKEHSNDLLTNFEYLKHKQSENKLNKLQETYVMNSICDERDSICDERDSICDERESSQIFRGELSSLGIPFIVQLLQECLVTMSAKDASLMILIEGPYKKSLPMEFPTISSPFWIEFPLDSGKWYKCQVSLVDISQKSPDKIFEHELALEKLENVLIKLKSNKREPPCCRNRKRKWEQ